MLILEISTGLKTGIMIVAMIAVFYLFLIRPQSQKAKEEKKYHDSLQKGDRVMTSGGIHATIVSVSAPYAQIEVAKDTRIKVQLNTLGPIPGSNDEAKK